MTIKIIDMVLISMSQAGVIAQKKDGFGSELASLLLLLKDAGWKHAGFLLVPLDLKSRLYGCQTEG